MSTVKIKTEPAAAGTAVDLKVKLEPSLSAADIKFEQHTSGTDTKVEPDSEVDSEEDNIKSENGDGSDGSDDGIDQNMATKAPNKQHQFICEHLGCGHSSNSASNLRMHQNEHMLRIELNMHGKTFILTRPSLKDRWLLNSLKV